MLPLSEVIAAVLDVESPQSRAVWKIYNELIKNFQNEYSIMIDIPETDLVKVVDPSIAKAILKVRNGNFRVIPGFDGTYGQLDLNPNIPEIKTHYGVLQTNINDFS